MQFVVITLFSALFAIYPASCQKNYGNSCKTTTGDNGVCMPSSECVLTDSELASCSYSGLVCCDKHHTSTTTNPDNRDSLRDRYSSRNDDINFPSEKINSPNEDYFPSSDSNSESSLYDENRSRWSTRHKPTHHSVYSHRHYDDGYGSFNSYHRPNNNKPSIYRPSYNKPTDNSFNYNDDSPNFDKEHNTGWRPTTTTSQPVWELETSEETKTFGARRKRISQIKCEEYSRPITETVRALPLSLDADVVPLTVQKCDFTAAKLIVGGVVAEVGEFPHMAAVGFRAKDGNIMWNCGGSLISDQYVMTAGHCTNTTYGNPVVVRLGEHNLANDNDDAQPEDYQVAQVIPHPRYKSSIKYNDIALLRLETPVRLTDKIRPACLSSSESYTDKPIASGWGRTDFVGRLSDVLMKVGLSIIDNKECNDLYKQDSINARFFKQGIVDSMLCAGELQGGKDTCFGDSGGPLQITNEDNRCLYHIIGITSFGKVCGAANSPGVYTRVSKFLPWIENTVWRRT